MLSTFFSYQTQKYSNVPPTKKKINSVLYEIGKDIAEQVTGHLKKAIRCRNSFRDCQKQGYGLALMSAAATVLSLMHSYL